MSTEVRPARLHDARAIATIHASSWRVAYRDILPSAYLGSLTAPRLEANWSRTLAKKEQTRGGVMVAEAAGCPVGFAVCGPSRHPDDAGFCAEVTMLYVSPEAQGAGIGSQLLSGTTDILENFDYRWLVIWVVEKNERARRFYRRHGLQFDGARRTDPVGGGKTPLVRLAKAIGPNASMDLESLTGEE